LDVSGGGGEGARVEGRGWEVSKNVFGGGGVVGAQEEMRSVFWFGIVSKETMLKEKENVFM
jgi:hypothetical protein